MIGMKKEQLTQREIERRSVKMNCKVVDTTNQKEFKEMDYPVYEYDDACRKFISCCVVYGYAVTYKGVEYELAVVEKKNYKERALIRIVSGKR